MRKMKKIITLAMTLVMMMAMSITAFAAEEPTFKASIKINGAEGANFKYVQVIEPDRTSTFGWKITDASFAAAIRDVLQLDADADDAKLITEYKKTAESNKVEILNKVNPTTDMTNPQGINVEGLYVVKPYEILGQGETAKYKYNNLAVAFNFDGKTDLTVNAKKSPYKPHKELKDEKDKVVEVTGIVPYKVEFSVPFYAEDVVKAKEANVILFGIKDTLTNGEFVVDDAHEFKITFAKKTVEATPVFTEDKKSFTLDLSELITEDNLYRNENVTIEYYAKVTGIKINNDVKFVVNDDLDPNGDSVESFTGTLQVKKIGENETTLLGGAKFVIAKHETEKVDEEDKDVTYYAVLNSNHELTSWTKEIKKATELETAAQTGLSPIAKGFDNETSYYFVETVAPEGYSVHEGEFEAVWNNPTSDDKWAAFVVVSDTQLIQLPFTGGMGTTIFTVLGVAIMAIAAALFFATKKSRN